MENRGPCDTFRSPNVSNVIGGDLGSFQTEHRVPNGVGAKPFVFSSPPAVQSLHKRSKTVAPSRPEFNYGRPKSAFPNEPEPINNVHGYGHRNLFQTAYREMSSNIKAPRPVSTAPDKSVVAFSTQKTRDPLEFSSKKLMREYQIHKAMNASTLKPVQEERTLKEEKVNLENNVKELKRQEKLASIPPPVEKQISEEV